MKYAALFLCLTLPAWAADDAREDFEANAYLGLSVDTFAASDFQRAVYSNQSESGKKERVIGGFDFEYRLLGDKSEGNANRRQLWIYGQTLHGVRSVEVDCSGSPSTQAEICGTVTFPLNPANAATAGKQLVHVLRNASSLEAFMGLRYEFLTLNAGGSSPARVYLNAQAGYMTVANSGGDVLDNHHVGLGILASNGRYAGSHIEVGYGRNDVFSTNRYRRLKVDGYLTWGGDTLTKLGMKPFVQMTVDSDAGRGGDSVQTFIGLNFDLSKIF